MVVRPVSLDRLRNFYLGGNRSNCGELLLTIREVNHSLK